MALSVTTIKATIEAELLATYGAPEIASEQDKFITAMAEVMFKVLTQQAVVVMAGAGVDTGGDSLITNQGSLT